MRHVTKIGFAAVLLSGAGMLAVAPAFAGPDEAHQDSFWANQAVGSPSGTHGKYMQMDPRDAKASAASGVDQADASNPYFNHAEGTMTGPDAVAQAQTSGSSNGQYVATYHQYMQVDPRDQKAATKDSGDASQESLYDHAMGTMSRP